MTLGNNPQPLTRRQARELAREQVPATTDAEESATAAEPKEPKPRRVGTPESTTFTELTQQSDVTGVVPVSAFAPRSTDVVPVSPSMTIGRRPALERTLTRRQLREIKAAEAAESGEAEAADKAPSADENVLPGPLNPPVGHWSVDRGDDRHTQTIGQGQPFDQFMSRGVGAGGIPTTTNALILPSIPQQGTTSGPLASTGEVLITGSFDLPRSLGATGQHPNHFDSSEMDHMLDQLDEGGHNSNVAPVSASRAVSTHTSTRGVMTPPKKRGASLPTVLAVTAAVLAVGVLALFVLGYVFRIF